MAIGLIGFAALLGALLLGGGFAVVTLTAPARQRVRETVCDKAAVAALVDSASAPTLVLVPSPFRVVHANPPARRLARALEVDLDGAIEPQLPDRALKSLRDLTTKALTGGRAGPVGLSVQTGRRRVWVRASASRLEGLDGERRVLMTFTLHQGRRAAEHYRAESVKRYETLYEKTPTPMHAIDSNGVLVSVSDAWLALLGYTRAEVIGRRSTEFLDETSRDWVINSGFPKLRAAGRIDRPPLRFRRRDGRLVMVELSAVQGVELSGERRIFAVLRDVTAERGAIERETRQNDLLLQCAKAANTAFWEADAAAGRFRALGQLTEWMADTETGADLAEMSLREALLLLSAKARRELFRAVMPVWRGAQDHFEVDLLIDRPTGDQACIRFAGRGLDRIDAGPPRRVIGVTRDVTQTHAVAKQLNAMEQRFRAAVECAGDTIYNFNLQTGDFFIYGFAVDWLGKPRDPKTGGCACDITEWAALIHPDDLARLRPRMQLLVSGKLSSATDEYRVRRPDGEWRRIRSQFQTIEYDAYGRGAWGAGALTDITNDHLAQMRLLASESRFRTAVECSGDAIYTINLESRALIFYGFIGDWFDIAPDPTDGGFHSDLDWWFAQIHPDDRVQVRNRLERMSAGPEDFADDRYRIIDPNGAERWLHIRFKVVERNGDGRAVWGAGAMRDITEERARSLAAQATERRFKEAAESTGDAVYTHNLQTGEVIAHGFAANWIDATVLDDGTTLSRYEHWRANIHPDDLDAPRAALARAMADEKGTHSVDYRVRNQDGDWRWMRSRFQIVEWDRNGAPLRIAGALTDITAEKTAQARAAESETRYMEAVLATQDAVYSYDWDAEWAEATGLALRIAGVSPDAGGLTGRVNMAAWIARLDVASLEAVSGVRRAILDEGRNFGVFDYRVRGQNGVWRWLRDRYRISRSEDGAPIRVFGALTDVTAELDSRRQMLAYASELEATNRRLERFAAAASHDLREPLRQIQAFSRQLQADLHDRLAETERVQFNYLGQSAARLQRQVEQLLSFSKLAQAPMVRQTFALSELAREAWGAISLAAEEVDAVLDLGPNLPEVSGDPVLLGLVMQNIFHNAIRYAKLGQAPRVRVGAERRDGEVCVRIQDNGMGFDPGLNEKVFEMFERAHDKRLGGAGMGLSLCRQIVERHGGRIGAEGAPGQWTTIWFALPSESVKLERVEQRAGDRRRA
ncbi:MAG: PAS domain-containing protein [Maricaulaceae bacterium]